MGTDITLIIAISVAVSILAAIVGMRTTWMAGSFFSRSRVDVAPQPAPTVTATPAQAPRRQTPEERLLNLKALKDKGVIDDAEYESSRAAVLKDVTG
jgi:hypothetical protein